MNKETSEKAIAIGNIVSQSTGSECFYRHWITSFDSVFTEGCKAVADVANAYWLIDECMTTGIIKYNAIEFQVWRLKVDTEKESGILTMCDDMKPVYTKELVYTDFPCNMKFYLINDTVRWTLLLPQEY